jgi:hypothetical protein
VRAKAANDTRSTDAELRARIERLLGSTGFA